MEQATVPIQANTITGIPLGTTMVKTSIVPAISSENVKIGFQPSRFSNIGWHNAIGMLTRLHSVLTCENPKLYLHTKPTGQIVSRD
jgi:hypothetical protein